MSQPNEVAASAPGSDEMTDYDRRLPHAKPTDTLRGLYFNAVFNAVKSGGGEQAVRQHHELLNIGKQGVADFINSMFGKTLMLLSGNSPAKGLASLPSGYSTSVNWGERSVTILSETSARVSFRGDLNTPCQNEGMLLAIVRSMNAKNPQVHSYPKGILDCDYEVTWEK